MLLMKRHRNVANPSLVQTPSLNWNVNLLKPLVQPQSWRQWPCVGRADLGNYLLYLCRQIAGQSRHL